MSTTGFENWMKALFTPSSAGAKSSFVDHVWPPSMLVARCSSLPVSVKLVQVTYRLSRPRTLGSGPMASHSLSEPSSSTTTEAVPNVLPLSALLLTMRAPLPAAEFVPVTEISPA